MSMYEYTLDEHVALLTMNESKFNMTSLTEFLSVLNEVEKDTDAKALIVRSSDEKIWSTGLDLEWLLPLAKKGEKSVTDVFIARLIELFRMILLYPMITVAAITGHAFAGGAVLACCFDFRFMRKGRGYLCFPEVDIGIPFLPSFTALMKKAIPMDLVEDMQLTARRLTAEECEARHIIVKACSVDELVSEAISFAKRLNKERPIVGKLKSVMHKDILRIMEVDDAAALKSLDFGL
ncbi:MAG: enoyl-CoA hydratase/isomerase family protein [Dehalococcoidia bacterium]|nr:enoyl-CoA hydratase/isomerase family protein [Dehalococcoidia bacterium]MDH4366693.1 enoyl-CoA hydratase/isomerase family protein [Dehalococcoidia bacterium]